MTTPNELSFADFARLLGVKPQAVTALRKDDRLVLTADRKRVVVDASRARIAATADPSKAGVAARHAAERSAKSKGQGVPQAAAPASPTPPAGDDSDDDGDTSPGYQSSRARREHYQALEAQRAYEVAIGKLMDAQEVATAVASAATTLRTHLERLPDVLGPQLAAISDESQARATMAEAIEHALEEVARQFASIARQVSA